MKKIRHKAILAVYLVLIKDHEILLHLRKNSGYEDGNYSLVAGHVEADESLVQAMMREAKEEIGIDIDREDLLLATTIHRRAEDGERVDFFFRVHKWKGEIQNLEAEKCGEVRFFPLDHLPENLIDYVRRGIRKSSANEPYGEEGFSR